MNAQLTGDDLTITPSLANGPKPVADGADWKWHISSTKAGAHVLTLTLFIVVTVADLGPLSKEIKGDERRIEVDVDPVWVTKDFAERNWQWAVTVALVPATGWLWRRWQRPPRPTKRRRRRM